MRTFCLLVGLTFSINATITVAVPVPNPTRNPTESPSRKPTRTPTESPTQPTRKPTSSPTRPTRNPTESPSWKPTRTPTESPTRPTRNPTESPSRAPTRTPTESPIRPTRTPTESPTSKPTVSPTAKPSRPTMTPSSPTLKPTRVPTSPSAKPTSDPSVSMKPTPALPKGKYFDRIYIIMNENTEYSSAIANSDFANIAAKGRLFTNFHGATHPSKPNYISVLGASDFGWYSDGATSFSVNNLVDLMEAKGVTWKGYAQGYGGTPGSWVSNHDFFQSWSNIMNNPSRMAKVKGASYLASDTSSANYLAADIKANTVAQVTFYTPDLLNDCHDKPLTYCGPWLTTNWFSAGGYMSMPNAVDGRTLVVVTFDEGSKCSTCYAPTGNRIYTVAIPFGSMTSIVPGESCGAYYSLYSLTQLIEENWELGSLGRNDAGTATTLQSWGGPRCVDSIANCNARTYAGATCPNNAKCSYSTVGNSC